MVALGGDTAGLFCNSNTLAKDLEASSKAMFEPVWRLPIMEEHHDAMKGKFSDLNNKGNTPYGGASQAAAFLSKFVDEGVDWAHLDIAGPGMRAAAKPPVNADGTGFGTSLLLHYLCNK